MTVLVDPDNLRKSGSRLEGVVNDVKGDEIRALCGSVGEYGHDELFGSMDEFCSAVLTGTEVLKNNVEYIGTALVEAAKNYEDSDEVAASELADLMGDLQARTPGGNQ